MQRAEQVRGQKVGLKKSGLATGGEHSQPGRAETNTAELQE